MTFFMYHDTWQMVRASIVSLLIEYTFFVIQVFDRMQTILERITITSISKHLKMKLSSLSTHDMIRM